MSLGNPDVICLGEALVDWVSTAPARTLDSALEFEKAPGGAPANVAVALARLGVGAAFAGGLSPDAFGQWLRSLLGREGVDTAFAAEIAGTQTRMAYVLRTEDGDRKLAAFSTVGVADAAFGPDLVGALPYERAVAFHFGSVTLASRPSADATLEAVRLARAAGCLISFDPNVRLALWSSSDAARRAILPLLSAADIVKVSDDEATFLTGESEVESAAALLWERYRPAALTVTSGARGAFLRHATGTLARSGFAVDAVDATGAGDAFVAGLLRAAVAAARGSGAAGRRAAVEAMDERAVYDALLGACALGALATTKTGAMAALPTDEELRAFLRDHA